MTLNLKLVSFILKSFLKPNVFCNKPTSLYTKQSLDLFSTYKEGFKLHTGELIPFQKFEDEQYDRLSNQLYLVQIQNKLLFPALNSSNNFATIDS